MIMDGFFERYHPDNVLYGSDYPHQCGRMEDALDLVSSLSPAAADRVRHRNAERIFRL